MTLEQAREIANQKYSKPLTNGQWNALFAAEEVLKAYGELRYGTYDED